MWIFGEFTYSGRYTTLLSPWKEPFIRKQYQSNLKSARSNSSIAYGLTKNTYTEVSPALLKGYTFTGTTFKTGLGKAWGALVPTSCWVATRVDGVSSWGHDSVEYRTYSPALVAYDFPESRGNHSNFVYNLNKIYK